MKKHNNELEIDEDMALERRTWIIQRFSWVIMLLILIAALLGFTGRGGAPGINKMKAATASQSMEIEYERFLRNEVSGEMKVNLVNIPSANPSVFFSKEFYENIRVEQVVPEPETVQVGPEGITYTFQVSQPESHIMFYTKPMHTGTLNIVVRGPNNDTVTLSQFVYP
ncbi:hypothetical protein H8S95_13785 [Pontibacter sp. KCTC 32443]|uniref:hypothetical protein n=1 Tax=Pontibacter TaxID=323449 RepID=UPI00164D677E|nr:MULTISPECIES: hypothetical protein [Pontibacter]MBC5775144.1 hypothetical protein [Pontibacter sp. KCTC 32443]